MTPLGEKAVRSISSTLIAASILAIKAQQRARVVVAPDATPTRDPDHRNPALDEMDSAVARIVRAATVCTRILSDVRADVTLAETHGDMPAGHAMLARPASDIELQLLRQHVAALPPSPSGQCVASQDVPVASVDRADLEAVRDAWLAPVMSQIAQQAEEIERLRAPMARLSRVVDRLEHHLDMLHQSQSKGR